MTVKSSRALPALLTTLLVVGCKTAAPADIVVTPDERLVPAAFDLESSDLPTTRPVVQYIPVAAPQLRPLPQIGSTTQRASGSPSAVDAVQALLQAKQSNTQLPRLGDFLNANQVYDYAGGLVYTAVCAPGFVTTLVLEAGEAISAITAGDTTRWQLETVEGASENGAPRLFVLLKPNKPECETNLVIITDRRVYQLDLKSVAGSVYHTQVSWNYPGTRVGLLHHGGTSGRDARGIGSEINEVIGTLSIDKLNFDYIVKRQKGPTPPWCPLRAFDDGNKTYIQFAPQRSTSEAPPLFVLSTKGEAQVVNYRVKGDYYVVDRLFDKAELRLGEAPQQLVRIERGTQKANR